MSFKFSIPTPNGRHEFEISPGSSMYFVGANGGGKTRFAVSIEEAVGEAAHRISAHRALTLDPGVPKVSEEAAKRGLRFGYEGVDARINYRSGHRWEGKGAIKLLMDFNYVVQALFADQSKVSLQTHLDARAGKHEVPTQTKFEKLVEVWDKLLPHRKLHVTGDDIKVTSLYSEEEYSAANMSDGERAVFYLLGQTLVAEPDSLIIFDEPELHIHRSIMANLWDELEALRSDCAMIIISHDLEFVASRRGQRFVLRDYVPATGWTVEEIPEDTGFSEEMVTLILGSRRPILFIEGSGTSLDKAIYRACYPDWMVIPRGSCTDVLHSVVTMRANASLTRVHCAGIVDADDYNQSDIEYLNSKGVSVLPVSEIENLLVLPEVVEAITRAEGYQAEALTQKLSEISDALFAHAAIEKNQHDCVIAYCRRRIDRALKKIDLSNSDNSAALEQAYQVKTAEVNIAKIIEVSRAAIQKSIGNKDAVELLKWYDNKGLMVVAAKAKNTSVTQYEQWLIRALRNNSVPELSAVLKRILPVVEAS